ncbi:MAG: hypothetical protein MUF16_11445 [Burkholderiaceae bacterium]|nr:hypothetical protein [Burkholderiaceae bacterium]
MSKFASVSTALALVFGAFGTSVIAHAVQATGGESIILTGEDSGSFQLSRQMGLGTQTGTEATAEATAAVNADLAVAPGQRRAWRPGRRGQPLGACERVDAGTLDALCRTQYRQRVLAGAPAGAAVRLTLANNKGRRHPRRHLPAAVNGHLPSGADLANLLGRARDIEPCGAAGAGPGGHVGRRGGADAVQPGHHRLVHRYLRHPRRGGAHVSPDVMVAGVLACSAQ